MYSDEKYLHLRKECDDYSIEYFRAIMDLVESQTQEASKKCYELARAYYNALENLIIYLHSLEKNDLVSAEVARNVHYQELLMNDMNNFFH